MDPYKKLKTSSDISASKLLVNPENHQSFITGIGPKSQPLTESTQPWKVNGQELNPNNKPRRKVDTHNKFKKENTGNTSYGGHHYVSNVARKPTQIPSSNQSSQVATMKDVRSERINDALLKTTPHIKFTNSLYNNQMILVLPSSLFGNLPDTYKGSDKQ